MLDWMIPLYGSVNFCWVFFFFCVLFLEYNGLSLLIVEIFYLIINILWEYCERKKFVFIAFLCVFYSMENHQLTQFLSYFKGSCSVANSGKGLFSFQHASIGLFCLTTFFPFQWNSVICHCQYFLVMLSIFFYLHAQKSWTLDYFSFCPLYHTFSVS